MSKDKPAVDPNLPVFEQLMQLKEKNKNKKPRYNSIDEMLEAAKQAALNKKVDK